MTGAIVFNDRHIVPQPGPVLHQGVVMLPFRAVMEDLIGAEVQWHGETRTISAELEGRWLEFNLDGQAGGIPVITVEGRSYVPMSVILDFLDA